MATEGRHSSGSLGWLPLLAVCFVAAFAFLVAAGVFELKISGPSEHASADQPAAHGGSGSAGSPSAGAHSTTPAESTGCKDLWAQELRVALAAERTLQEWRLHVDAMDQLVAGEITLPQATAIWDASRQGDQRRIERFQRLDASLRHSPTKCDTAGSTGSMRECQEAARAVERTIDAARTAVKTWKVHIRDMRMLRAGEISSREATQRWHRLWEAGLIQTGRYDHRAANALAHDCS